MDGASDGAPPLAYPGTVDSADVFVKRPAPGNAGDLEYEVAGLEWLRQAGAPVVRIREIRPDALVLERLHPGNPNREDARKLGASLALLHAAGAPGYGAAPRGYTGQGWMGRAPLELVPNTQFRSDCQGQSWGKFYANLRIRPYITDVFTPEQRRRIKSLFDLLETGTLDHAEPRLVRRSQRCASRIHGDLWAGNVIWTARGAILIDPAAQGGHAEEDLATLALFRTPYLSDVIRGYQDTSPLAEGWEGRVGLHQLHTLAVHCYLFGASYVPGMMARVDAVLKEHGD